MMRQSTSKGAEWAVGGWYNWTELCKLTRFHVTPIPLLEPTKRCVAENSTICFVDIVFGTTRGALLRCLEQFNNNRHPLTLTKSANIVNRLFEVVVGPLVNRILKSEPPRWLVLYGVGMQSGDAGAYLKLSRVQIRADGADCLLVHDTNHESASLLKKKRKCEKELKNAKLASCARLESESNPDVGGNVPIAVKQAETDDDTVVSTNQTEPDRTKEESNTLYRGGAGMLRTLDAVVATLAYQALYHSTDAAPLASQQFAELHVAARTLRSCHVRKNGWRQSAEEPLPVYRDESFDTWKGYLADRTRETTGACIRFHTVLQTTRNAFATTGLVGLDSMGELQLSTALEVASSVVWGDALCGDWGAVDAMLWLDIGTRIPVAARVGLSGWCDDIKQLGGVTRFALRLDKNRTLRTRAVAWIGPAAVSFLIDRSHECVAEYMTRAAVRDLEVDVPALSRWMEEPDFPGSIVPTKTTEDGLRIQCAARRIARAMMDATVQRHTSHEIVAGDTMIATILPHSTEKRDQDPILRLSKDWLVADKRRKDARLYATDWLSVEAQRQGRRISIGKRDPNRMTVSIRDRLWAVANLQKLARIVTV